MIKTKTIIFIIAILLFNFKLKAGDFAVRIYSQNSIKSVVIVSIIGKYSIYGDEKQLGEIEKSQQVSLTVGKNNKIRIIKGTTDLGLYSFIEFEGQGLKNIFNIKPQNTDVKERIYDDNIEVSVEKGFLKIINVVDIEHYVAGVVQSEILGSCDSIEFFKIQALITRTYAINNMMKHYKDGYNLCDDVHCQAYKSRCNNYQILMATTLTTGDVIVDKNKRMISAAFCSNSGGETINSEDIWSIPTTYLKSVIDTFSLGMRNSTWEYKMPAREWLKYLADNYNYPINDSLKRAKAFNFEQPNRLVYFHDSIPLKSIRRDLNLKSTFFSIKKQGDFVIFNGRGYGHGVGLSQEGAIKMIKNGYTAEQVIKFYYQDVSITNYNEIKKIPERNN